MRLAVSAGLVAIALAAPDASACVPIDDGLAIHELDPAQADDHVAPAAPQVDFTIARGETGGGCLAGKTDCDGKYADIYIDVVASDDATPTDRLGYIVTATGADKPSGYFHKFDDGRAWDQAEGSFDYGFDYDDHDYSFDVQVVVVDLNGNMSPPTVIHVEEHESGGCQASHPRSEWLLLPVLGLILRRRRRC